MKFSIDYDYREYFRLLVEPGADHDRAPSSTNLYQPNHSKNGGLNSLSAFRDCSSEVLTCELNKILMDNSFIDNSFIGPYRNL